MADNENRKKNLRKANTAPIAEDETDQSSDEKSEDESEDDHYKPRESKSSKLKPDQVSVESDDLSNNDNESNNESENTESGCTTNSDTDEQESEIDDTIVKPAIRKDYAKTTGKPKKITFSVKMVDRMIRSAVKSAVTSVSKTLRLNEKMNSNKTDLSNSFTFPLGLKRTNSEIESNGNSGPVELSLNYKALPFLIA